MTISREGAEGHVEALNGILDLLGRNRRLKLVRADHDFSVVILERDTNRVHRVASLKDAMEVFAAIDKVIRERVDKLTE